MKSRPSIAFLLVGLVVGVVFAQEGRPVPPERSRRMQTLVNVKQTSLATLLYASGHDDTVPDVQNSRSARSVLRPFVRSEAVFYSAPPKPAPFLMNLALAGARLGAVTAPHRTILWHQDQPEADAKRAVGFAHGGAQRVDALAWRELEPSLRARHARKGRPLPKDWMPNPVR